MSADLVGAVFGGRAGGDLIFVDQALVETRSFAVAEHRAARSSNASSGEPNCGTFQTR